MVLEFMDRIEESAHSSSERRGSVTGNIYSWVQKVEAADFDLGTVGLCRQPAGRGEHSGFWFCVWLIVHLWVVSDLEQKARKRFSFGCLSGHGYGPSLAG